MACGDCVRIGKSRKSEIVCSIFTSQNIIQHEFSYAQLLTIDSHEMVPIRTTRNFWTTNKANRLNRKTCDGSSKAIVRAVGGESPFARLMQIRYLPIDRPLAWPRFSFSFPIRPNILTQIRATLRSLAPTCKSVMEFLMLPEDLFTGRWLLWPDGALWA